MWAEAYSTQCSAIKSEFLFVNVIIGLLRFVQKSFDLLILVVK